MLTFESGLTVFKELLQLLTVGGATLSVARIGPGRAAWIALWSRFAFKPKPECLRHEEIKLQLGQRYLVVTGEKGVGKTCLINTATSKTPGVIKIKVEPENSSGIIIEKTLRELSNPLFSFMNPIKTAQSVIFWYRLFTLGRSPIVVISTSERGFGQQYADITGAVRTLVDLYKLRVIVDGSSNSINESLLRTHRERVFNIQAMTKEMIWKIEQLQDLFNPRKVIGDLLCAQIAEAIKIVRDCKVHKGEIIELFDKEKMWILSDTLTDKKLVRPTPDKFFREVLQDDEFILIPASNAVGIVLKHSLRKKPSLEDLEKLLKNL